MRLIISLYYVFENTVHEMPTGHPPHGRWVIGSGILVPYKCQCEYLHWVCISIEPYGFAKALFWLLNRDGSPVESTECVTRHAVKSQVKSAQGKVLKDLCDWSHPNVLKDMLESVQNPALGLVHRLLDQTRLTLPWQEGLAGGPAHTDQLTSFLEEPRVQWTENIFKVNLDVPDAQFDDFKIETQRLVISSFSGEVQYELDWELFGRVEPERCLIKPNPTKTIIQLRKCEQGYWGHLTKDKKKPRYLSKAYDSIVCSDEEDQVDDDSGT